jgi:hypothetical protein
LALLLLALAFKRQSSLSQPGQAERQALKRGPARIEFQVRMSDEPASKPGSSARPDGEMEQPERVDSEVPDTSDLLDALLQRAWLMFLDERESPKRSRIDRAAECQTIKVICLVDRACTLFWKDSEAAIRQCCQPRVPDGLIDQQQVFGYLLADVFGRPLLTHEDARPRGLSGSVATTQC